MISLKLREHNSKISLNRIDKKEYFTYSFPNYSKRSMTKIVSLKF